MTTGFGKSSTFEKRVRACLQNLTEQHRTETAGGQTPRLSVKDFTAKYKIARSTLYRDYKYLVAEIEAAFRAMKQESASLKKCKPSVTALQAEVIALKKRIKYEHADLTTRQWAQVREQMGPILRSRQEIMLEHQALVRQIGELEDRLRRRDDLIANLTRMLNKNG